MKKEEIVRRLEIERIYDHLTKKTFSPLRVEILEEISKLFLIELSFIAMPEEKMYTISIVANSLGVFFVPKDWRKSDSNPQTFEEATSMNWEEMYHGTPALWIDGILYLESP